jgi:hypothetical protein
MCIATLSPPTGPTEVNVQGYYSEAGAVLNKWAGGADARRPRRISWGAKGTCPSLMVLSNAPRVLTAATHDPVVKPDASAPQRVSKADVGSRPEDFNNRFSIEVPAQPRFRA